MSLQKPNIGTSMGTAATILALASCASYALGLFRDRIFAHVYGASASLDAFYAAFTIPDLLFNLFIAGIISHAVFVPVLQQYYQRGESSKAWELANSFLNVSTALITTVGIIAFFAMPYLIKLVAPGFEGEQAKLAINLTRLMLLQPILFGISNTFGSILVSLRRFSAYAFAPAIYNLGIMVTTLLFYKQLGVYAAIVGVLVGVVIHLVIRLWDLSRTSYRYRFAWNTRDPGFRTMIRLAIPRTLALVATQANLYAYTAMGSLMATGSIAVFNFARNLQSFPVSLVGIAMSTAALPTLAAHAHAQERAAYSSAFSRATRYILFLALPASAGMLLLGPEIVSMTLRTGAFDPTAALLTQQVLLFLTLAITFESMKYLLATSFYAHQDTKTPVVIALLAMVVNISISWYFKDTLGVRAFGLGFFVGELLQVIVLSIHLRKHWESTQESITVNTFKIVIATALMASAVWLVKHLGITDDIYIQGGVSIVVGITVYLMMAWLFRMPELSVVPAILRKLLRRP